MIYSSASGLSPKTTVVIDQVPVDYFQIQRIEVEFSENMHDLMILEFAGLSPELMHLYIETPILVTTYVDGSEPFEFYGYIVFMDPMSESISGLVNNSPFQVTRAYCLGASYKMRYKKFKVWESRTLASIVKDIAMEHSLSAAVPSDPYVFPRMVQSEESDWAFLVRAANSIGYNVNVSNTHIHVWDPYEAMSRNVSFSRLETIKGSGGDLSAKPGQVIAFEARIGDVTPEGSRSSDTLFGLDESNQIVSASNRDMLKSANLGTPVPTLFSNVMSGNANSFSMAKKKTEAALRKKFPITASAMLSASTSIKPGGIVYLDKYESQFDGFWYVNKVRHNISQAALVTHVDLAKDSLGEVKTPPQPNSEYVKPPAPAIINGKWVASFNSVNVYS